jgi:hypothetical protein
MLLNSSLNMMAYILGYLAHVFKRPDYFSTAISIFPLKVDKCVEMMSTIFEI